MSNRRYEIDVQEHINRSTQWLLSHAASHKEKKDRCASCEAAERIADGLSFLRSYISFQERLEADIKEYKAELNEWNALADERL